MRTTRVMNIKVTTTPKANLIEDLAKKPFRIRPFTDKMVEVAAKHGRCGSWMAGWLDGDLMKLVAVNANQCLIKLNVTSYRGIS